MLLCATAAALALEAVWGFVGAVLLDLLLFFVAITFSSL
jgi:hypothetical protein